jgi:hypothetical protein
MAEVAAWQGFGAVGLGLTLARQIAEMIPEASGLALQSPYLLKSDNLNTASVSTRKQGLVGEHPFYHLHPCQNLHASLSLFLEAGDQQLALEGGYPAGVKNVNKSLSVKSPAMKYFAA